MKSPKAVFRPTPNYGVSKLNAVIIGDELTALYQKMGAVRPEDVVDSARSKASPLHKFFTWDDSEAAELWRREEAARLIRCVCIVEEGEDGKEEGIRAFHSVKATAEEETFSGQAYLPASAALTVTDYRDQIINAALEQARGWAKRYKAYREFFGVVKEIERVERRLTRKKASLARKAA